MNKLIDLVIAKVNKTLEEKGMTTNPKDWREKEVPVVNAVLSSHPSVSQTEFSERLGYHPNWFSNRKINYL
jgi:hypothetical protein